MIGLDARGEWPCFRQPWGEGELSRLRYHCGIQGAKRGLAGSAAGGVITKAVRQRVALWRCVTMDESLGQGAASWFGSHEMDYRSALGALRGLWESKP